MCLKKEHRCVNNSNRSNTMKLKNRSLEDFVNLCHLAVRKFKLHIWKYLQIPSYTVWRRQWHPTPVLLPGRSHGWRSLEGCSPWGRWGLDMTERLHFHFSFSFIGEGNSNPLQCSCPENPRDGGTWWAAVYGIAQSQTRLKWLSSSRIFRR